MTAFSAATDALFRDANLAADATWLSTGSDDPVSVRVIMSTPDDIARFGASSVVSTDYSCKVRVADIARPAAGDRVTVGIQVFDVPAAPQRDTRRLVWTVPLIEADA